MAVVDVVVVLVHVLVLVAVLVVEVVVDDVVVVGIMVVGVVVWLWGDFFCAKSITHECDRAMQRRVWLWLLLCGLSGCMV